MAALKAVRGCFLGIVYFGEFSGKITNPVVLDRPDKTSDIPIMNFWDRIDPLAETLGASAEARRKWRERNSVPGNWHIRLLLLARKRGVDLSENELLSQTNTGRAA